MWRLKTCFSVGLHSVGLMAGLDGWSWRYFPIWIILWFCVLSQMSSHRWMECLMDAAGCQNLEQNPMIIRRKNSFKVLPFTSRQDKKVAASSLAFPLKSIRWPYLTWLKSNCLAFCLLKHSSLWSCQAYFQSVHIPAKYCYKDHPPNPSVWGFCTFFAPFYYIPLLYSIKHKFFVFPVKPLPTLPKSSPLLWQCCLLLIILSVSTSHLLTFL